jgi:hypothetical protein
MVMTSPRVKAHVEWQRFVDKQCMEKYCGSIGAGCSWLMTFVFGSSVGRDLDPLLRLGLLCLGDDDLEDAVLNASLDVFVVDRVGEVEAAGEFSNATL